MFFTRPGLELRLYLADKEKLRHQLIRLVYEIVAEVSSINTTITVTPSPYAKESRALPSIYLAVEAADQSALRDCLSKIKFLCIKKGLSFLQRMTANGYTEETEPVCASLELSPRNNRHRTIS